MLRGIVGWSLEYRFLVLVATAALLVFVGTQLGSIPVDVLPEFAPVYVEVQTEALGLSASEVETLVTINVEELLMGTPWVEAIRSRSVPGLSSILLISEPGTDTMLARQLVQERLNLAWGLPNVSKPPVILQPLSATNRVMMVGLDSDTVSPIQMSVLARWNIRPALMGVDGVANVSIWGQRRRQLQVQVDPERLRAYGITLDQIIETTGDSLWVSPLTFVKASTAGTGGWIDTPQQRIDVRHVLPISEPDDLARVAVAGMSGLSLSDVANVVEDHQPLIGDALLVLYTRGATVNSMVLAGFIAALGIVIDDAIVEVGNISQRLRQASEGDDAERVSAVRAASSEMRGILIFGTLSATLVVVPVFLLEGRSGLFYRPMALSYLLAAGASSVVALTLTPALSFLLLANAPCRRPASPAIEWLERVHQRALLPVLKRTPRVAYLAVTAIGIASLVVLPFARFEPLPQFRERDLLIQWEAAPGTSHPAMMRLATEVSRELRAIPGVRDFAAHVGRAVLSDKVADMNSGDLWVSIDPGADYEQTVAAIKEVVDGYPGLIRDVRTYLEETLSEVELGTDRDMVVRVFGRDFETLHTKAEEVRQVLAQIDGIVDLAVEPQVAQPYAEIEVDLAKAQSYGIKPGDVRRAASTLLVGIEVGSLFEEQKVFDVVVWGAPETRHSLTSVRELLIDTPGGGRVRLDDVADVRVSSTLTTIDREAISRRIDVSFNVSGRPLGAVARDVEGALSQIEFPRESHADLLGDYSQRQASRLRILVAAIAAVIGIYLLLQAAVESWRLAALILVTVPWALAGGMLAALLAGGSVVALGELVGLFTLFGIAVHNSVMLIRHYQSLEEEGEISGPELVLRGSRERFASVVITAVATGLVMAPFAVADGRAGLELAHPMAVVILAGLVTSTLLSLFVMPVLYLRFRGSSGVPAASS